MIIVSLIAFVLFCLCLMFACRCMRLQAKIDKYNEEVDRIIAEKTENLCQKAYLVSMIDKFMNEQKEKLFMMSPEEIFDKATEEE